MSSGEELVDGSGRNPTQRLIDEELPGGAPVDEPWAPRDELEELDELELEELEEED